MFLSLHDLMLIRNRDLGIWNKRAKKERMSLAAFAAEHP